MAVILLALADSSARTECKNCKRYSGWLACGGYRAGESREGMISLWTALGGEFAMAVDKRWITSPYGGLS